MVGIQSIIQFYAIVNVILLFINPELEGEIKQKKESLSPMRKTP